MSSGCFRPHDLPVLRALHVVDVAKDRWHTATVDLDRVLPATDPAVV